MLYTQYVHKALLLLNIKLHRQSFDFIAITMLFC
jgi:hypothetical protein